MKYINHTKELLAQVLDNCDSINRITQHSSTKSPQTVTLRPAQ